MNMSLDFSTVVGIFGVIAFLNLLRKGEIQETLHSIVAWPFRFTKGLRRKSDARRLRLLDCLHEDPRERFNYVAENVFMLFSMFGLMATLALLPAVGESGGFVALVLIALLGTAIYAMALRLNALMGQLRRYETVRAKLLASLEETS